MISIDLARALQAAGLVWRPSSGDAFRIERPDFEGDVFTVSDMTIELHASGTILGFNGTTEWALDSLPVEHALWMPREEQLRELLRGTFRSLTRLGVGSYRVKIQVGPSPLSFDSVSAADAYGLALLTLIGHSAPVRERA